MIAENSPPQAAAPAVLDPIARGLEELAAVVIDFPEQVGIVGLERELRYARATLHEWHTLRTMLPVALGLARRAHEAEARERDLRKSFDKLAGELEERVRSIEKGKPR